MYACGGGVNSFGFVSAVKSVIFIKYCCQLPARHECS